MDRTVAIVSDDDHSLASTLPCLYEHDPYANNPDDKEGYWEDRNESMLLEAKDLEGTTDDINYHLFTFWNTIKHAWRLPCVSLEYLEYYRRTSVKPRIFPWRVNGMCTSMRSLLYARLKELELHTLSDSFEEEREFFLAQQESYRYEQEMEERTNLYLEERDNVK
jgi:hypothetical protein